jgi:hypothetical protein
MIRLMNKTMNVGGKLAVLKLLVASIVRKEESSLLGPYGW